MEQNPLPYLARYPEADVLTSSDQVVPTVVDDSLEIWQEGEYVLEMIRIWMIEKLLYELCFQALF